MSSLEEQLEEFKNLGRRALQELDYLIPEDLQRQLRALVGEEEPKATVCLIFSTDMELNTQEQVERLARRFTQDVEVQQWLESEGLAWNQTGARLHYESADGMQAYDA